LPGHQGGTFGRGIGRGIKQSADPRRVHRARTDAVTPNLLLHVVDRHGASQTDYRALRCAVGGAVLETDQPRYGRGVDDDPTAGFDHVRKGVLAAEKHATHIDGKYRLPQVLRCVHDRLRRADPGIIAEHIDTREPIETGADHGLHLRAEGHICLERGGVSARLLHLEYGFLGVVAAHVRHEDPGALRNKRESHGADRSPSRLP